MKIRYQIIPLLFMLASTSSAWAAVPLASQVLELRVENRYLSPNSDGIQDSVFFTPILKSEWSVDRWRLDVVNEKGKIVYRNSGAGFSTLIQWDGTDKKGVKMPEGTYRATLYAWGEGSRITSEPETVIIDNTPPLVELSVSTALDEASCILHPRVQESSPLDRWLLQFVDLNGRTLHVISSSGSLSEVRWPDSTEGQSVAPGPYKVVFQAWDKAGNESSPVFADCTVRFSGNRSVRASLKKIDPEESQAGLMIRLTSSQVFSVRNGKPFLKRGSSPLLDEVALLVNAYPQSAVRLDGYSFSRPSAAADRDLGSLYAWTVYSYLVKQGSVQASRLTVRGRGRISAEERGTSSPVLKNGVEIWLLGSGPW